MNKQLRILLASLLLTLPAAAAPKLGDAAPPLDVSDWIKGSPVKLADGAGKNIYVIEFWATWCGPCRTSIPHLTELQKKFKDQGVIFVGLSDEKPEVVKKFVEKMGDKMDYTVAIDAGKTTEGYMEAFGVRGIPHAFVVDKQGRIVWHGHPMAELESTLEEIVAGKYDLEKSGKRADAQEKLQRYVRLLQANPDSAEAEKLGAELVELDKELGGLRPGMKFDPAEIKQQVQFSQLFRRYQELVMRDGDTNEIQKLEAEIQKSAPANFDLAEVKPRLLEMAGRNKEMMRVRAVMDDYMKAVGENGNPTNAAALGKKIEQFNLKDPEMLNDIAWTILTEDTVKQRDLKLALSLARSAVQHSNTNEPAIIDTYARALFDNGQVAEAIAQQKKAIELADDEELKAELREQLKDYEKKPAATK